MPVSAEIGIPGAIMEEVNHNIKKCIQVEMLRKMNAMATAGRLFIKNFEHQEAMPTAPDGQRPTYNNDDFKCFFPEGAKKLPLRKSWVTDLEAICADPAALEELLRLIKAHDAEFNPNGIQWTLASKRQAETDAGGDCKRAKTIPLSNNAPTDPSDLGDCINFKYDDQVMYLTIEKGEMWCLCKKDGVLSSEKPICLVFGDFVIDKSAETVIAELVKENPPPPEGKVVVDLSTENSLCSFDIAQGKNTSQFSEAPCTIGKACQYAEEGGYEIAEMFGVHSIVGKSEKDAAGEITGRRYEVTNQKKCVFTAKKSTRQKANQDANDAGYLVLLTEAQKTCWKSHEGGTILKHSMGHIQAIPRMGQHGDLVLKTAPSLTY